MQRAGGQVHLPGSQPGSAGRQSDAVLRTFQCLLDAQPFGKVDDDAKQQRPVDAGFALRMRQQLAHVAVDAAHPVAQLQALLTAVHPAVGAFTDMRGVVGVHKVGQPLPRAGCGRTDCQAVHGQQPVTPGARALVRLLHPIADAGGTGHGLEAALHVFGAPAFLTAFGDVQRHTENSHRPAVGVAQHHAAHELVVPTAVAMAVARFHVHRLRALQCLDGRRDNAREVIGVDQIPQFLQVHALRARRLTQRMPALRIGVDAPTGQVVAPDGDAAQVDGQRQLRLQLAGRGGQRSEICAFNLQQQSQRPSTGRQRLAVGLEAAVVGAIQQGLRGGVGAQRGGRCRVGPQRGEGLPLDVAQQLQGCAAGPLHAPGRVKLQDGTGQRLQQRCGIAGRWCRGVAGWVLRRVLLHRQSCLGGC